MPRHHRILVVDDDQSLLHVLSMYLNIEGYDVETARDGHEALRAIAVTRPDVVILDVMMAGMDGLEACRTIKSDPATRDIPVVMFTALSRDEDLATGQAAGADRFINKPFSLVGLGAVIRGFTGEDAVRAAV